MAEAAQVLEEQPVVVRATRLPHLGEHVYSIRLPGSHWPVTVKMQAHRLPFRSHVTVAWQ